MEIINWFSKNTQKTNMIGFEDVKYAIKNRNFIINTLPSIEQDCLIFGTVESKHEEQIINSLIENNTMKPIIIIYGKNSADTTCNKKYNQLLKYGFQEVYIYGGGLFEWLLLQDIYGSQEFPTIGKCRDILNYRSPLLFQSTSFLQITR